MKPRQPEIISRCQFRQTRSLSNKRKSILEDERSFSLSTAFIALLSSSQSLLTYASQITVDSESL